jgi:putative colanic acid biosynthesis glycosyltransferase WcaI
MRLQLWSWNYEPEPTAMGPISALWARTMRDRGHDVTVIAAHPHYPAGLWKQRVRPYREVRDGIPITRLPLRIGHANTRERIVEELSYMASTAFAAPFVGRADVVVTVSPAFLALLPAMANVKARRVPWVLWLQDILPDAASTTGLLENSFALRVARMLESLAYRAADCIVVISETFEENLLRKGVRPGKLHRIYNPATRGFQPRAFSTQPDGPARILYMGNIGFSQGLTDIVRSFERGEDPSNRFRLVITGGGERENEVRREIRSDRVEWLGLVSSQQLDKELCEAALGLVSQRPDIVEFNVPSKLMTLMGRGVPVLAIVSPNSEAARIVRRSGGGWVAHSGRPDEALPLATEALRDRQELERRAEAARAFAEEHFSVDRLTSSFESILGELVAGDPRSCAL